MKTIEQEYKNQISLEIPDLWNRIEAGIDEYESKKSEMAEKIVEMPRTEAQVPNDRLNETTTVTSEEDTKRRQNKKVIIMAAKVVGAAACLLVAMRVIFLFGIGSGKSESSNMALMADSAPAMDACVEESAAETMAEEAYDDYYAVEKNEADMEDYSEIAGNSSRGDVISEGIAADAEEAEADDVESQEIAVFEFIKNFMIENRCSADDARLVEQIFDEYEIVTLSRWDKLDDCTYVVEAVNAADETEFFTIILDSDGENAFIQSIAYGNMTEEYLYIK